MSKLIAAGVSAFALLAFAGQAAMADQITLAETGGSGVTPSQVMGRVMSL